MPKNFKAAAKEVKKLVHAEEVLQYCTNRQVSWEYIVERAPWWGGLLGEDGKERKGMLEEAPGKILIDI